MSGNSIDLIRLLKEFSDKLKELKIKDTSLDMNFNSDDFKKIDEDLYFRQNKDGKDYIPSDDLIELNVGNLLVKIHKE